MPRNNKVSRTLDGKICIVLDSIKFTLSEQAFIDLMQQGLLVVQALERERSK